MTPIDRLRARFQRLCSARDSGTFTMEHIWLVWKVDREAWSHEYWILKLELTEMNKINRARQDTAEAHTFYTAKDYS
jgi:hypothetical protein